MLVGSSPINQGKRAPSPNSSDDHQTKVKYPEALDAIFYAPEEAQPLSDRKIILAAGDWQLGVRLFPNGMIYKGLCKDNEPNGQGEFLYPNGRKYVGCVLNGQREGYGIMYRANGRRHYEGSWSNGKREGHGISYYRDGSQRYKGNWMNGRENGFGKRNWPEGKIMGIGNWANGHLQGKATWYAQFDHFEFTGHFNQGVRNGKGVESCNGIETKKGVWIKGKFQRIKKEVS